MGKTLSVDKRLGFINIQLDKPKYVAGDQVNGWVHLSLAEAFPSNVIYLLLTGKEKIRFVVTRKIKDSDNKTQTEIEVHQDLNEFYSHTFPLYSQSATNNFPAGQYSFPFSFKLGDGLPGTFRHVFMSYGQRCFGKIQYKLKAGMKDQQSGQSFYGGLNFIVDQRWELPSGPQTKHFTQKLRGFCYSDLGELAFNCHFDKDKFIVGETANLKIILDCLKAKSRPRVIICQLLQTTTIQSGQSGHSKSVQKVVSQASFPNDSNTAQLSNQEEIQISLPIRTDTDFEAGCDGKLVKNDFKVLISIEMNSCLCFGENIHQEIPVKVFNRLVEPKSLQPQMENWNPVIMNPYVCTIAPESRMTQEFKAEIYPNAATMACPIKPNTGA